MAKIKELEGLKIGKLTVLNEYYKKGKHTYWKCRCECGKEKLIYSHNLISGKTKSCGCIKNKHIGGYKSKSKRLVKIFIGMKQRCYNPNAINYKKYGAKGVKICNDWLNDSRKFYEWSENNGYNDNLTIDRIDTRGNYEPDNCRWVTYKEQNNNTTRNRLITRNGITKTVSEWANYYGVSWYQFSKTI